MNIIEKIEKMMKERNYNKADVAKGAGIPYTTFDSLFKKGYENMRLPTLKKIADFFHVSMEYLINDNINEPNSKNKIDIPEEFTIADMVNIPIVGVVRAGVPMLAVENIESYFHLPKYLCDEDKEYFGLKVKGDSMNLEFHEGSILIIEKTTYIENNEIGVVLINGFDATVKKVAIGDETITLIPVSSNPVYKPQTYNMKRDDIRIIGKVKFAIKTY